jgi:Tfp pilus assembly protein FimT
MKFVAEISETEHKADRQVRTWRAEGSVNHRIESGHSLVEMVLVVALTLIISAFALPTLAGVLRSYRAVGDAKGIASQLSLARMRAASDFTRARMNFNLTASTYQLEIYNKNTSQFQVEGGSFNLSQNDSFGFGTISTPAGSQSSIGQAAACLDNTGKTISNSACIIFNSRGIPVDSSQVTTSNDVIYLSNGSGDYYAVSVATNGRVGVSLYSNSVWIAK